MKNEFSNEAVTIGGYQLFKWSILGKGTTGIVYKGIKISDKTPVAIKAINLDDIRDEATRSLLQNEKLALRSIKNQHVIKLFDIVEENGFCYIVTQLCQGGTLKDYITKKSKIPEGEALQIFKKILIGCNSLTQNCIIHRDLKPANIILRENMDPVIIDFGYCEIIRAKQVMKTFNVGSPSYMAPEAYQRTLYSQKSDSWSIGVILYEMLHGRTIDQGRNIKEFFQDVRKYPTFIPDSIDSLLSSTSKEIISKSLKHLPEDRLSISGMKYLIDVHFIQCKKANSALKDVRNEEQNQRVFNPPIKSQIPWRSHRETPSSIITQINNDFESLAQKSQFSVVNGNKSSQLRVSYQQNQEVLNQNKMSQLHPMHNYNSVTSNNRGNQQSFIRQQPMFLKQNQNYVLQNSNFHSANSHNRQFDSNKLSSMMPQIPRMNENSRIMGGYRQVTVRYL